MDERVSEWMWAFTCSDSARQKQLPSHSIKQTRHQPPHAVQQVKCPDSEHHCSPHPNSALTTILKGRGMVCSHQQGVRLWYALQYYSPYQPCAYGNKPDTGIDTEIRREATSRGGREMVEGWVTVWRVSYCLTESKYFFFFGGGTDNEQVSV